MAALRPSPGKRAPHAFSVLEIVVVLVIVGILSKILIPHFTSASSEPRDTTLKDALRYLRTQITVYKSQHADAPPGYPDGDLQATPDGATFIAQMTHYTDEQGHASTVQSPKFSLGPYLSGMPINPLTSQSGVLVVPGPNSPDPDPSQPYGWIYNPQTLQIIANLAGNDDSGIAYNSY